MVTALEGNNLRYEEHLKVYDVADEVSESLKNDLTQAGPLEFLGFDQGRRGNEEDLTLKGPIIW